MAQNFIGGGGGHRTEKNYNGRGGGTAHTFLMGVLIGVGTPHNIEGWEGETPHTLQQFIVNTLFFYKNKVYKNAYT